MNIREGDTVLVRGRVVEALYSGGLLVSFGDKFCGRYVDKDSIAKVEVPAITTGDRVAWTGKDRLDYAGEVLSISLEPTGAAWAWVKCPAVPGGFATLKTTELRRA